MWFPPPRKAAVNPVARVKKHFKLKTTSQAQVMINTQDPRLFTLKQSELDYLGLYVKQKLPFYKRWWRNLKQRYARGVAATKGGRS